MSFQLKSNLGAINGELRRRAAALVRATAHGIEAHAKASMPGAKSGRTYKRGRKTHQASAEGEAPAVDYGVLINSFQVEQENDLRAVVGVGAEYAVHLEFGTARMGPRPFLGPAFEAVKPAFEAAVKGLLK